MPLSLCTLCAFCPKHFFLLWPPGNLPATPEAEADDLGRLTAPLLLPCYLPARGGHVEDTACHRSVPPPLPVSTPDVTPGAAAPSLDHAPRPAWSRGQVNGARAPARPAPGARPAHGLTFFSVSHPCHTATSLRKETESSPPESAVPTPPPPAPGAQQEPQKVDL